MKNFLWSLIGYLMPKIIEAVRLMINKENFIKFADKLLDWVERRIEAMDPENDDDYDEWLLEFVKIVRETLQIPDLPDDEV